MCNSCKCENSDKCSIKGNAPVGWCCPQCISYNPFDIPCTNKYDVTKTKEVLTLKDFLLSDEIY